MHKSTLSNIADDSKWGGLAVLPVRETWATRSFMWIDKGKCTVLHLGRNNARHQHTQVESSLAEMDLEVLVNSKLPMSQLYALVAKQLNSILGFVRKSIAGRLLDGDCSCVWSTGAHLCGFVSSFGLPSVRRMCTYWSSSRVGTQRQWRDGSQCCQMLSELALISLEKIQKDHMSAYKYLMGRKEQVIKSFFSVVPIGRTRDDGHK